MQTSSYADLISDATNHYNQKLLGKGKLTHNSINNGAYYGLNAGDSPLLEGSSSSTQGSTQSTSVKLSPTAMKLSEILLKDSNTSGASAGFDSFLSRMREQLDTMGGKADVLQVRPNSLDAGRLSISEQATNFLLSKYYNTESAYPQASSENPFAGLDRHSLSKIAFDDSGDFAPAERYLAFLEMGEKDIDFINRNFDLANEMEKTQGKGANWSHLIGTRAEEKLISSMTEAEKNWRGVSSTPDTDAPPSEPDAKRQDTGTSPMTTDIPSLPAYQNGLGNSETSFFAITENAQGEHTLASVNIQELMQNSRHLNLLDSTLKSLMNDQPNEVNDGWVPYQNLLEK
ncbi:hypothetical protein C8E00_104195 [Chromohalobacter marismortui]|uniref:Uncharacterized protein n=1 Tax=Chromohalobacter marismortui TaxID=42055 RepID=A0A4R7NMG5_9GAMM|nr:MULTISPECIES: hypothetical protein [Chromohalobacter]MCI0509793.1 hypothetical protein [Chromohalobacter sp.]MCI0592425.1 hypothetical protein [Chromohalobacter sp.]TDU22015.1 hypothetical protein C8E00_104195 [Chromohalobacter marismortui]